MRVIFAANLIHADFSRTGVFATKNVEIAVLPCTGMEVESKGLGAGSRRVLDVTVNIDGKGYDAYINLSDIMCPSEPEFNETIQNFKDNGWEINGQ